MREIFLNELLGPQNVDVLKVCMRACIFDAGACMWFRPQLRMRTRHVSRTMSLRRRAGGRRRRLSNDAHIHRETSPVRHTAGRTSRLTSSTYSPRCSSSSARCCPSCRTSGRRVAPAGAPTPTAMTSRDRWHPARKCDSILKLYDMVVQVKFVDSAQHQCQNYGSSIEILPSYRDCATSVKVLC